MELAAFMTPRQTDRVKAELKRAGMRQYQLAHLFGLSETQFSHMMNRKRDIEPQLANYLIKLIRKEKDKVPKAVARPATPDTRYYWLRVSNDKYELPEAVADTCEELAAMCGCSPDSIRSIICKHEKGALTKCRWRRVKRK